MQSTSTASYQPIAVDTIADRVRSVDWTHVLGDLETYGVAQTGPLLTDDACDELRNHYDEDALYRSRVVMRRHGFGEGEYKYFKYPIPDSIQTLRASMYPRLVSIANAWMAALGHDRRYPDTLADMLDDCRAAGQARPTPLILRYEPGDYNCLHQDLYGEVAFPIQLVVLLSAPGDDFTGGDLVLTEQRPRMQSRAEVVSLKKGHGALFAVNERPKVGTRGTYRVKMRHGVSRVRSGARFATGVIFHDAA